MTHFPLSKIINQLTPRGGRVNPPKQQILRVGEKADRYYFDDDDMIEIEYSVFNRLIENQGKEKRIVVYKPTPFWKSLSAVLTIALIIVLISSHEQIWTHSVMLALYLLIAGVFMVALTNNIKDKPKPQIEQPVKQEQQQTPEQMHLERSIRGMMDKLNRIKQNH